MKIISIEDSPTFGFHPRERAKVNRKNNRDIVTILFEHVNIQNCIKLQWCSWVQINFTSKS